MLIIWVCRISCLYSSDSFSLLTSSRKKFCLKQNDVIFVFQVVFLKLQLMTCYYFRENIGPAGKTIIFIIIHNWWGASSIAFVVCIKWFCRGFESREIEMKCYFLDFSEIIIGFHGQLHDPSIIGSTAIVLLQEDI